MGVAYVAWHVQRGRAHVLDALARRSSSTSTCPQPVRRFCRRRLALGRLHRWADWQSEVVWMSLYFSVAVWMSIGFIHLPARMLALAQSRLAERGRLVGPRGDLLACGVEPQTS